MSSIVCATWEDVIAGRARWSFENRDGLALAKKLPDGSIHHTIGDPPYDEKTHSSARSLKDGGSDVNIDFQHLTGSASSLPPMVRDDAGVVHIVPACESFVPDLLRCTRRWVMQFCTQEMARDYEKGTKDESYQRKREDRNYIRAQWWVRTNGAPQISGDRPAVPGETIATMHSHRWEKKRWNGGGDRGYYTGPICDEEERLGHPTQKPEWLMLKLIEKFTDEDDIIFDWSSGVATTGAAALKLRRRFIGTELKGPCPKCGGGFPSSWNAAQRRKVLALVDLKECVHEWTNYYAIGRGRLAKVSNGYKQQSLFV